MSSSFEEHLRLVSHVLSTLKSYGLKVKPEKCSWFKDEVDYLGHLVGVRKSPQFVAKVRDFPKPSTMGELRSFLGLANFQRKFVANFSSIQKPLSEKTTGRKSKLLHWSAEMNEAFETIKEKIAEDVCLSFPDYGPDSEPLQLFVDASGYGAGACLTQLQQNEQRIIAYSSTTFSKAERGYSTIERELAGLRWAVKSLRPFLMGCKVDIFTDHQPLIYLHTMQILDCRLARTLEDLAGFDYRIVDPPGKENIVADLLSRVDGKVHFHINSILEEVPGTLPAEVYLMKAVPGGGDSLFESLLLSLDAIDVLKTAPCKTHQQLRTMLVEELLKKPQCYDLKLDKDGRKRLRAMEKPGHLPSMNLLPVFCNLFGCRILVHYSSQNSIRLVMCLIVFHRWIQIHQKGLLGLLANLVAEW